MFEIDNQILILKDVAEFGDDASIGNELHGLLAIDFVITSLKHVI